MADEMDFVEATLLDEGGAPINGLAVVDAGSDAAGAFVKVGVEDGVPRLYGVDDAVAAWEALGDAVRSHVYDGSEEERKLNKSALATVRRVQKETDQRIRKWEKELMASVEDGRARLKEAADDLVRLMDERRLSSDEEFKAARSAEIEAYFEEVADAEEALDGISWDDLSDPSWLNRSTPMGGGSGVRRQMEDRIDAFKKVVSRDLFPCYDPRRKASLMSDCDWDALSAMDEYERREEQRMAREALAEQQRLRREEAAARAASRTLVRVSVLNGDLDRFWEALRDAGIDAERA